jgi:hypothetical protein
MAAVTPIVFIHMGNSAYLPYALLQCRTWNPRSDIFLLGDSSTKHLAKLVSHVPYSKYSQESAEFANVYRNYSTNGTAFELPCFQRWFVLYEFLAANGLDGAVYLDSDILAYSDLVSLSACREERRRMTVVGISAHTNFIHGREVLRNFLDFVKSHYTPRAVTEEVLKDLLAEHQRINGPYGGISDMTFLTLYRALHPDEIDDISKIAGDQTCFDITLGDSQGVEMVDGIKAIRWIGDQPFCRLEGTDQWVRFHTLHFQGRFKRYLRRSLRPRPWSSVLGLARYDSIFLRQKLARWFRG